MLVMVDLHYYYKVTKLYFQHTFRVHMPVRNSGILTKDFSSVRLPTQGLMYCGSQSRWTFLTVDSFVIGPHTNLTYQVSMMLLLWPLGQSMSHDFSVILHFEK
jgi:hypothetical protein